METADSLKSRFLNPVNVGDADSPSFVGRTGSLRCGAGVRVSLQIDESHTIKQARFRVAGCDTLTASLSFLTERIEGSTTAEAASWLNDPHEVLGDGECIRPDKEPCLQLACDAVLLAIREYSDATRLDFIGEDSLICTCFFVTEQTIESEIRTRGLSTVREVTQVCNAGAGCGSCHQLIQEIIDVAERV